MWGSSDLSGHFVRVRAANHQLPLSRLWHWHALGADYPKTAKVNADIGTITRIMFGLLHHNHA